ncbi:MAG: RluA family pseudouridine synthase [Bacteroidota bacterium]
MQSFIKKNVLEEHLLKIESHKVPQLNTKERLQDYAVGVFRNMQSRKGVKNAIKKGLIYVNAEVGYTGDWISGGETIELYQNKAFNRPALDFKLEVLYEDEHLAIIYKPAGVLVSGNKRFTIENALTFNLAQSTQDDALSRPEPIHRLDYPTSGALLIGKTVRAVIALNLKFEHRSIAKTYAAVTIGDMNTAGTIETPIDGKPSKSEYKKLISISSEKYNVLNLMVLHPHTGRRHQLRKHLSQLGHPIFGDAVYGKKGLILKGKGLFLHAVQLQFEHPVTEEFIKVVAPLPKKFTKLFPKANTALGIE